MKKYIWLLGISFSFLAQATWALTTEIGISYSRKKTSFDERNYTDSESTTGSVSLYFMERIAIELSYTDGSSIREEYISGGQYTIYQKTKVLGADLIYVLADRKAFFQPYIKGGGAQLTRQQIIKIPAALSEQRLDPEVAVVPSYGIGFKLVLTDSLGFKISYDAWRTPIGGTQTTDDSQIRAGITWVL